MTTVVLVLLSLLFVIFGYCFGSILFSDIFAKILKKDIRSLGSKNPGATNTTRSLGKTIGILVAFCDASKSYLSVLISFVIIGFVWKTDIFQNDFNYTKPNLETSFLILPFLAGFFAIIGHCFPINYVFYLIKNKLNFEKTKNKCGGKGVSSMGGFIFAISPWMGLIAFFIWMIFLLITRYVSVASICSMLITPTLILITALKCFYMFKINVGPQDQKWFDSDLSDKNDLITLCVFLQLWFAGLLVTYRHKPNLIKLYKHEEQRINFFKK